MPPRKSITDCLFGWNWRKTLRSGLAEPWAIRVSRGFFTWTSPLFRSFCDKNSSPWRGRRGRVKPAPKNRYFDSTYVWRVCQHEWCAPFRTCILLYGFTLDSANIFFLSLPFFSLFFLLSLFFFLILALYVISRNVCPPSPSPPMDKKFFSSIEMLMEFFKCGIFIGTRTMLVWRSAHSFVRF